MATTSARMVHFTGGKDGSGEWEGVALSGEKREIFPLQKVACLLLLLPIKVVIAQKFELLIICTAASGEQSFQVAYKLWKLTQHC